MLVGIMQDLLLTLQQRMVYMSRPVWASLLTILITAVAILVIDQFIETKNYYLLAGYILGTAVGTYVGMKIRLARPKNTK
jgi:uncharacterized membrane protein YfcA